MPGLRGVSRVETARSVTRRFVSFFGHFAGERRGSIAPLAAFMIIPLIGAMALAGELSFWFMTNRSMQNAADSAAVAAATNNTTTLESGTGTAVYQSEAQAVAANYGYTNGVGNVTVTATATTASPCPSGQTCFQVTVSKIVPLYLMPIVGFSGNTTLNGSAAETLSATAMASPPGGSGASFCILALGGGGVDLTANGGPHANMTGCDVASNANMTCNGGDLGADAGYAVGVDNGCGAVLNSKQQTIVDPYNSLDTSIPASNCGSGGAQSVTGTPGGTVIACNGLTLTGDTTYPKGTTLVVVNGPLNTNGHTFTLDGGTVIFTDGGTAPSSSATYTPTGGGRIVVTAPSGANAGIWSGIAIYQDPRVTTAEGTLDVYAAGNSPDWDVVGMNYFPKSNFTIKGAVGTGGHGTASGACQGWVVNSLVIDGTGYIVDNNGCVAAGLTLPSSPAGRAALIS